MDKAYIGIIFKKGSSNFIVPQRWLDKRQQEQGKLRSWWPANNAEKKAKENIRPDKKTWTLHACSFLVGASASTYARCVTKMYTEHPIGSTTAESANGTETAGGPSPTDQDQHRSVAPIPPNISFTAMQLPVRVDAPPMQERQCCCNEVNSRLVKIERRIAKGFLSLEREKTGTQQENVPPLTQATTTEELDKLADNPQLIRMLKPYVGMDTGDTFRKILKNTMNRGLAIQYSYTGLGSKRQKNKRAFGEHKICRLILDNLHEFNIKEDRPIAIRKMQSSLRGVRDWPIPPGQIVAVVTSAGASGSTSAGASGSTSAGASGSTSAGTSGSMSTGTTGSLDLRRSQTNSSDEERSLDEISSDAEIGSDGEI